MRMAAERLSKELGVSYVRIVYSIKYVLHKPMYLRIIKC